MFHTEPDRALAGRRGYWPAGKVLGGSSSIDAMVFVRGQPQDYDEWAALGNPGWGWDDVLPYFLKLEDSAHGPGPLRAVGGPLRVTDPSAEVHPLCETYLRAGEQLGVARNPDINAGGEGLAINQITTRDGRRESSSTAYLRPALRRFNLKVSTDAQVTGLWIEGRRARGVRYVQHGQVHEARVRCELIVAAGTINTPQLLQLSGVGLGSALQSMGIPVVADLPAVGQHLQDHLCIESVYRSKVPTLNRDLSSWPGRLLAGVRYVATRRGPLSLSPHQGGGFVRTRAGLPWPNLQLAFAPLSCAATVPGRRARPACDPFPGFTLGAQPCRPTSRGFVSLRSPDPAQPPRIVPNSLATQHDRDELLAAARFLRALAATPALSAIIDREIRPGAAVQSDEQLIEDIAQRASTAHHPVGTCKMGADPRQAVVDATLCVHGLQGLRVVDASVFPTLTSGNPGAPVIMLAEKAADLILADHPAAARG
jgi:choline dehydrogenase